MKCVKISQQLFIKINSEIIYHYSTFTEMLVRLMNRADPGFSLLEISQSC